MTKYSPEKAARILLAGKAQDGMEVDRSLYLSGTQITALPDNLTVYGSLDLSGTQITCPTPWFTENGEITKRRAIAIDASYALIEFETGQFRAGCRGPWTREQCLKHWGKRSDARAKLFTAALEALGQE